MNDKKFIEKMANFDGCGYGDLEARSNDDRKLNILLAKQNQKIQKILNWLTFFLVIVGIINIFVLLK